MSTVPQDIVEQKRQEELRRQRELALAELKKQVPGNVGSSSGPELRAENEKGERIESFLNKLPEKENLLSYAAKKHVENTGKLIKDSAGLASTALTYGQFMPGETAISDQPPRYELPENYIEQKEKERNKLKKEIEQQGEKLESKGKTAQMVKFERENPKLAKIGDVAGSVPSEVARIAPYFTPVGRPLIAMNAVNRGLEESKGKSVPDKIVSVGKNLGKEALTLGAFKAASRVASLSPISESFAQKAAGLGKKTAAFSTVATARQQAEKLESGEPITVEGVIEDFATNLPVSALYAIPSWLARGKRGLPTDTPELKLTREAKAKGEAREKLRAEGKLPYEGVKGTIKTDWDINQIKQEGWIPTDRYNKGNQQWIKRNPAGGIEGAIFTKARVEPEFSFKGDVKPGVVEKTTPDYQMPTQPLAGGIAKGMPGSPDWSKSSQTFLKKAQEKPEQVQSGPRLRLIDDVTVKDIHGNKTTFKKGHELSTRMMGGQVLAQDGNDAAMPKNQFEALKGKAVELGEKSAIKLPEGLEVVSKVESEILPERVIEITKAFKEDIPNFRKALIKKIDNIKSLHGKPLSPIEKWNILKEQIDPQYIPDGIEQQIIVNTQPPDEGGFDWYKTDPYKFPISVVDMLTEYAIVKRHNITPKEKELWYAKINNEPTKRSPKHAQHIKNRGENYKETLIKAPLNMVSFEDWKSKNGWAYKGMSEDALEKIYNQVKFEASKGQTPAEGFFKSSHWDEPNVIAHVLSSEYQTTQGDKVFNINETQSDWEKRGRSEGYKDLEVSKKIDKLTNELSVVMKQAEPYFLRGEDAPSELVEKQVSLNEQIDALEKKEKQGIPYHPHLKNWLDISLTQALKDAVESGAKYLSWDDGQTVKDRYDLSRQVDEITINKEGKGYRLKAKSKTYGDGLSEYLTSLDDLDKYIGKEIAKRAIEQKENKRFSVIFNSGEDGGWFIRDNSKDMLGNIDWKMDKEDAIAVAEELNETEPIRLSGLDLKVGGEWADHLYNRLIPKKLKEMTKKLGGMIVEIEVNDGSKKQALLITPEIIQSVHGGLQPMAGGITRRPKYYRGGGEGSMPIGVTAQDIVDYEVKELGNNIKVESGIDLKQYPSESLQWLSLTKKGAKQFGEVQEKSGDFIILARDPDGGVLVSTRNGIGRELPDVKEEIFDSTKTDMPLYDNILDDPDMEGRTWRGGKEIHGNYWRDIKGYDFRVVRMSPDEYLRRAAEGFASIDGNPASEHLEEIINTRADTSRVEGYLKEGKKLYMPVLEYTPDWFTQEGIHRALVAKKLGVESMPVFILAREGMTVDKALGVTKQPGVGGGKDFKDLKLFHGSKGKVYEETKSFKNVWENDNQNNLLKELAKDGVKEAGFLVGKYKPNNWVLSDRLIARVAKSRGYDAVMYSNSDRPQLGFEIHDVNEGKFYAEKKELAELYAKQKRDLKHKSVGAAGKDLPTDNIPLEGFPEKLQVKNVEGESVNVTTTPNEKISIDLVQNPDGTVEYELHDGKTVTIPASTAIKLVRRFGKVPTKKVSQATLDKELRDSQRPLSALAKKLGGLIIEDESSLKGELKRLREFDKNLVKVKTNRSGPRMSLDRHLEAAVGEGLLPRGSDLSDYLDKLEDEYSPARDFFESEKALRDAEFSYRMGRMTEDPFAAGAEDPNIKQRGFARNVQRTTEDPETIRFLEELKYHVEANADVLKSARKALDDDRNAAIMRVFDPEDKTSEANAIGMLAASDFMKKFAELRNIDSKLAWDNWELATDMIEHVATKGTIQGQAIQILSRWITLSPEGALRFALRQKEKFAKKDMNNYIALQKEKDNLRGIKKSEFEYIQEAKKKFGVKLSRKGSEKIYDAAKNLEEQSNAEAKVQKEFARVRDVYRQEVNKLFNLLKNLDTSDPVGAGVYNMLMNQPNLPQYTKKAIKRLAKRSGKIDVKAEVAMGEAEKATHFNNIIALYKEPQFLKNKKLKADIQSIASAVKAFGINDNALTDYESKQFEYLAEAAKTEALRDITLESLQEEAPTRFLDKLFELRASSFLTGPRTHIINNLTQGMMTADNVAREIVSASIDLGREVVSRAWHSVVGGDPYLRERYFGEAAYDVASLISTIPYLGNYVANMLPEMMGRRGFGRLIKEGWIKSWKGLPSESSKIDVLKAPAIKGLKGKIIRSPFHALGAFDSMFYEVNRVASLNALAYRMAAYTSRVDPITGKLVEKKPTRQEIKSRMAEILENPTEEMLEQAHKQSLEMIFRRALGEGTRIVGMLRESQTPLGDMFKYVVPFFHTPIAVPIAFMERSPFPIALASPRFWKDVKAGGGKRSDAYARHFIGTVLSSALIYWALKEDEKGRPYITAGIPRDEGERELWYRLGIMPYSILIGNRYWSWQRLAPISMHVAFAAAVASLYKNRDKKATDMAIQMAQDMAMSVINQPFVTGVKDLLNALTDPNRYGGNWIERQATSPIPVILKQSASALDNTVRRRESMGDMLLGSIPVLSQYVEPQIDLYGRDKKYQGSVAERLLSPFPSSELRNDPVDLELFRLKLYPKAPGQKIRGIKIDDDMYRNFRQRFGEILHTGLSEYIASEDYKELSDEEKRQALDSSFNRLLNQGRQDVLKRHLLRKADELKNEPIKKREEFGQELVDKRIVKDQDELERMMEKLGLENWYPNPPREYLPYEGE